MVRNLPPVLAAQWEQQPLLLERRFLGRLLETLPTGTPLAEIARNADRAGSGYYVAEGVAVVPVFGTMMKRGSGIDWLDEWLGVVSAERLTQSMRSAVADPDVRAILLQVDSPGGETRGMFDLADAIFAARAAKPVWAIADEWAFSAGYLVASAAERVIVPRTGGVGSIGVYAVRVDATGLDAAAGVQWTIVESGARKADGHPHKALSDEERDDLQASVDRIADLFIDTVAKHRGLDAKAIRGLEARALDADAALAAGLVDGIGTFTDTILDLATAPIAGAKTPRREKRMDKDTGADIVSLDEHRAKVAEAEATAKTAGAAEGRSEARAQLATFTNMCTAAGRLDLLAGFVDDPKATVDTVAKALADAKAQGDGPELHGERAAASAPAPTETFTFADYKAIHAARDAAIDAANARRPTPVRVA